MPTNTLKLHAWEKVYDIRLFVTEYWNGTLAITMEYYDEDFGAFAPYATLTVNLCDNLPPDCSYVDINNLSSDIMEWIEQNNLGEFTGKYMASGYCKYPLCRFNLEEVRKYV